MKIALPMLAFVLGCSGANSPSPNAISGEWHLIRSSGKGIDPRALTPIVVDRMGFRTAGEIDLTSEQKLLETFYLGSGMIVGFESSVQEFETRTRWRWQDGSGNSPGDFEECSLSLVLEPGNLVAEVLFVCERSDFPFYMGMTVVRID